jgi:hypothetical protein
MCIIFFMIFSVLLQNSVSQSQETDITIIKALELSNIEARKLNYNVEEMEIRLIGVPVTWKELQKRHWFFSDFKDEKKEIENKLVGKEFWLVYYLPIKKGKDTVIFGGDLWVFVEKHTGKILTAIRGK